MKPNRQRIAAWVAALRGGAYKRIEGHLGNAEGFCPLGVACDLWLKAHGESWLTQADPFEAKYLVDTDLGCGAEYDVLPSRVADWYGLEPNPDVITLGGFTVNIATLNDEGSYTFAQTASALERTFLREAT